MTGDVLIRHGLAGDNPFGLEPGLRYVLPEQTSIAIAAAVEKIDESGINKSTRPKPRK